MCLKNRKKLPISLLMLSLLCLLGCGKEEPAETVPSQVQTVATEAVVITESFPATEETIPLPTAEEVTMVVTPETIAQLEDYPCLMRADLSGSTCYEEIFTYMRNHPEVAVTYTVSLGETTVSNEDAEVTLESGTYDYLTLAEGLGYLPQMVSVHMPATGLLFYEMSALMESYPAVEFDYTVDLLGKTYSWDTTSLDLSFLTPEQAQAIAEPLALLFRLETVELMTSGNQSKLDKADVKLLVDAVPHANFHYEFTLFGKKVSTTDERLEYKGYNIGDKGETELRAALDIMTGCTYVKLDNCKLSNTVLDTIRDDYRDRGIKVVWRIYFGKYLKYNALTDTELIRAVYNVGDSNCEALRYCEDVKYIDMGHNDGLSNLSFLAHMPNLEILIVSGCGVKDLSGIENCKKLEFAELAYCGYLKDITPLSGCESLKYLNLSYTPVSNLMALDGLPLERFICLKAKVPAAEQEIFTAIHPDCWTRFLGSQPYGIGWRYDDNGVTYSEIYRKVRDIFGYDNMPVE